MIGIETLYEISITRMLRSDDKFCWIILLKFRKNPRLRQRCNCYGVLQAQYDIPQLVTFFQAVRNKAGTVLRAPQDLFLVTTVTTWHSCHFRSTRVTKITIGLWGKARLFIPDHSNISNTENNLHVKILLTRQRSEYFYAFFWYSGFW